MFQVSCFYSGLKVQPSILFYVSSFIFLVLLKIQPSMLFYVSSFIFLVLLKIQPSKLFYVLIFLFYVSIFVFYVSSFMFLLQERHEKNVEPGRFEPRSPVLQVSSLTPTPGGIAGQHSKSVIIYKEWPVSGFRFRVGEC